MYSIYANNSDASGLQIQIQSFLRSQKPSLFLAPLQQPYFRRSTWCFYPSCKATPTSAAMKRKHAEQNGLPDVLTSDSDSGAINRRKAKRAKEDTPHRTYQLSVSFAPSESSNHYIFKGKPAVDLKPLRIKPTAGEDVAQNVDEAGGLWFLLKNKNSAPLPAYVSTQKNTQKNKPDPRMNRMATPPKWASKGIVSVELHVVAPGGAQLGQLFGFNGSFHIMVCA